MKFDPKHLGAMFQVWKAKACPLDKEVLSLYPEIMMVFEEETAGFGSHPATLLQSVDGAVTLIERMGVLDPESDKVSGHTFTAAALWNLFPKSIPWADGTQMPDLIVHHGVHAINEYNNPDLLPGMGFEDKQQLSALSFQKQAQYYLNLADHSFWYHHSYLFVVLNIIQQCLAHLHTYFTCKRSHFDQVTHQLMQVSSKILDSLASCLERE
ncbi:hypothetical protein PAXRUDRAFT_772154, partial [Paxillus rubicundulus Ve08.2h10]